MCGSRGRASAWANPTRRSDRRATRADALLLRVVSCSAGVRCARPPPPRMARPTAPPGARSRRGRDDGGHARTPRDGLRRCAGGCCFCLYCGAKSEPWQHGPRVRVHARYVVPRPVWKTYFTTPSGVRVWRASVGTRPTDATAAGQGCVLDLRMPCSQCIEEGAVRGKNASRTTVGCACA